MSEARKNIKVLIHIIGLDVAPVVGGYYLLRLLGAGELLSLLVGTALGLVRTAIGVAINRKVSGVALFTAFMFGLGMSVSLIAGDARFLLAMKSVTTAAAGILLVATCLARRPAAYGIAKQRSGEDAATLRDWDHLYANDSGFRRIYYVMTLTWGGVLLGESAARLPLIYLFPLDTSTLLSTLLLVGALSFIVFWSATYGARKADPYMRKLDPERTVVITPSAA
ncbi:MAG TPA: VC0807 family protein [Stackebrandtia sp.]|uniref:VC0807 family protein n=1 Tax=Stackebrandtia sp. TaxID=2023065 RepID=UPI002D4015D7|nr:VC0807 family protein [Stackebrandtia sp.]HZE38529.1 VC0807 family protein [Stackebrandtia sp.]